MKADDQKSYSIIGNHEEFLKDYVPKRDFDIVMDNYRFMRTNVDDQRKQIEHLNKLLAFYESGILERIESNYEFQTSKKKAGCKIIKLH